jgi:hypothetical protein
MWRCLLATMVSALQRCGFLREIFLEAVGEPGT